MTDGPVDRKAIHRIAAAHPVEALAGKALSVLASNRTFGTRKASEPVLDALKTALLSDATEWRGAVDRIIGSGDVSNADIIDRYVPDLARLIGARWCEDSMGFAEVSIGSARLQGLVREADKALPPVKVSLEASDVAVIVRDNEDHSLGATVLTSQLRRLGLSVEFRPGRPDDEVLARLKAHRPDAVLISSSSSVNLPDLARFIEEARCVTGGHIPIALGGPVLELSKSAGSITGADIATSEIGEVLRRCRLRVAEASKDALVRT